MTLTTILAAATNWIARRWADVQAYAEAVARHRFAQPFRPLLHILGFYPLLLAIIAFLYATVFGVLLSDYEALRVLWNDTWWIGLFNGVGVAFILGGAVLAAHLLDRVVWAAPQSNGLTQPAGWCYWASWGVLVAVAALPAVVRADEFRVKGPAPDGAQVVLPCHGEDVAADLRAICARSERARLWFPAGLVLAGFGAAAGWACVRNCPDPPLVVARGLGVFLLFMYLVMILVHVCVGSAWAERVLGTAPDRLVLVLPAPWPVLLQIGLLTAIAWQFTRAALAHGWWLYPATVLVLVVPFLIPSIQTRYQVPGLEVWEGGQPTGASYYDAGRRPQLADYDRLRKTDVGLLADRAALAGWHERMKREYGEARPVVVVAVSGGASASALYVADVLFTLEHESPGFSDQVRVLTGASGGMLGAAYFVAHFRPHTELAKARARYAAAWKAARGGGPAVAALRAEEAAYKAAVVDARARARVELGSDFLGPIMQQWVHKDLPFAFFSSLETTNDRGRALEFGWNRRLTGPVPNPRTGTTAERGVLDVPFPDLRGEEADGRAPSLIFTPMMIEDGRQLLISNLDLDYMVDTFTPNRQPGARDDRPSHTGMEFFRLFPKAADFRLRTAVRLNASFPYFSPSARLPTNPERQVVDAGYYDNYGSMTATRWIARHTDWLNDVWWPAAGKPPVEETPAVYLLQIRCFAFEAQTRRFVTQKEVQNLERVGPEGVARTETGLHSLTAPLFGLLASWRANMVYRGDERVNAVSEFVRLRDDFKRGVRIDRVLYECPFEPSVNWVLTDATRWRIAAGSGGLIETDFGAVRAEFATAVARRAAAGFAGQPGVLAGSVDPLPPPIENPTAAAETGHSPAAVRREFYWRLLRQAAIPGPPTP